ncbi:MAG TPA: hypothetical protein VHJ54_04325, partial [Solirubrobacterales bacterium]|nr:hypothetical protein [Solirubrobacterales bacterium]
MDLVADVHRRGDSNTRQAGSEAAALELKRAFLTLARRRHRLTAGYESFWRRSRRYEGLFLAAELGRLQRRCLDATHPRAGHTGGETVLRASLERDLAREIAVAEEEGARLKPAARDRAETRARRRLEEIVAEVMGAAG